MEHDNSPNNESVSFTDPATGLPIHVPHYLPEELDIKTTGTSVFEPESVWDNNGRSYHGFKEGKYFLPNDAHEQERLDLQHTVFLLSLDGRLSLAPMLDTPKYVMDVATGTGIWALDFAEQFPKSYVIGTDKIQGDRQLQNCEFIKEDAEEEWLYQHKFDFIHLRAVVSCFKNPKRIFDHAVQNLNPGGWIEYHDFLPVVASRDGSHRGTAVERTGQLFKQALAAKGYDPDAPLKYKEWMIEAGFLDVVEIRRPIPYSGWSDVPTAQKIGEYQYLNITGGLRGITYQLFKGLGMSDDEHDELVTQWQRECKGHKVRAYSTLMVVYGRKPFPGEPWQ